jgi:hypothetical protein
MADSRWTFRKFEQRNDLSKIKSQCYTESARATDGWGTDQSEYQDEYIEWPLQHTKSEKCPPDSVHFGTGNLAPTGDELRSHYQQTYRRYPESRREIAKPLPNSDLFSYGYGTPRSTTQAANDIVAGNLPEYDNSEAKFRRQDGESTHFVFGEARPDYISNYTENFTSRRGAPAEPALQTGWAKSNIEFDHDAGYGPNSRRLRHKVKVPSKPDAKIRNQYKSHFDLGHTPPNYETTMASAYRQDAGFKAPERVPAPPMAVLADHGPAAPPWDSTYHKDFRDLPRIPNDIDTADLRATHFDPGHDPDDWTRKSFATTARKPEKQFFDLQQSNVVFTGDGDMRFNTTADDLLGVYDKSQDGRGKQIADARADHLFLGSDRTPYETTSKWANRRAGTGKPAPLAHEIPSCGFARGGLWEPRIGPDPVSEADKVPMRQLKKVDGSYFTGTHFELEATANNKGRYKTEYFERICRPKILEDRKQTGHAHY